MWLLFEGSYYSGYSFYSNKYSNCAHTDLCRLLVNGKGNRKDLVCSCGHLNGLCNALIRFGAAIIGFRDALPW